MPTDSMHLPLGHLPATRYPDIRIELLDKRFRRQGNAAIERIAHGFRWAEGPVYFRDGGYLLWSDIPNNRIMRWLEDDGHVSVFRAHSNFSNGNTRDREGRLITCEHDTRRVTRTEHDGRITVLIDRHDGKRLNAPNDVIVDSTGAIWFTDPGYGIDGEYEGHKDEFELPGNVYRLDPATGKSVVVIDDFVRPNGLALSPDERLLYVVDSGISHGGPAHIRVFAVEDVLVVAVAYSLRTLLPASQTVCASTSRGMCGAAWDGLIRSKMGCAAMPRTALSSGKSTFPRHVRTSVSAARSATVCSCARAHPSIRSTWMCKVHKCPER
jgi:SMP-30/Gluconolactonase/LRE-like region